jgi:hypothetical protein
MAVPITTYNNRKLMLTPRPEVELPDVTQVFEIPSVLEAKHRVSAVGDYYASWNFMAMSYAHRLGLPINRTNTLSVLTGSGNETSTVGSVIARFRFECEPEVYSLKFDILPDCMHDIILGKAFLKATKTFSSVVNEARRVVKGYTNKLTQHHALFLGDSGPKFTSRLNGQVQAALADSGCKVLLMDEDYAQALGLPIVSDDEHRVKLLFADNTTAMTTGMTFGVKWKFGTHGSGQEHSLNFHVMKNAPASVLLSDEFLFATNAYSEFDAYLVDEEDDNDEAYFLAIDIDPDYLGQGQYS